MIEIIEYRDDIESEKLDALLSRTPFFSSEIEERVRGIIDEVRRRGNDAVLKFTKEFDGVELSKDEMKVTEAEIEEAHRSTDEGFLSALREAIENIRNFHKKQKINSWFMNDGDGVILGKRVLAIQRVGLYVPGGLVSSLLMSAVPAEVAGVEQLYITTPPQKDGRVNPSILAAAWEVGVQEIYKVGGAQAIAALTFGTETIPKVDKIVGPGNIYVITAKKLVFGLVGIEMLPGPSEIVILADGSVDPKFIAADLLSQAEHGTGLEPAVLVTTSRGLAEAVKEEISRQVEALPGRDIIEETLRNYGAIILVNDLEEGIEVVNEMAPEHLELMVENGWELLDQIKNAGAIFMGPFSPVAVGDFFAGTNHILPTGGTARFSSSLGVGDFLKTTSIISYTGKRLSKTSDRIIRMAEAEGLDAHVNSVRVRLEGKSVEKSAR